MKNYGFTLIEFVVTVMIAIIFLTIAVPNFYTLIQNNKVVSMANKLSASFNLARMEAVRRGIRVSICPAGNASYTSCGSATQWAQGWIVFLDSDNNNLIDSTNDLIKVQEALPQGTTVTATTNLISYTSSGFLSTGATSLRIAAAGCTGNNARTLSLNASGRLSVSRTACN